MVDDNALTVDGSVIVCREPSGGLDVLTELVARRLIIHKAIKHALDPICLLLPALIEVLHLNVGTLAPIVNVVAACGATELTQDSGIVIEIRGVFVIVFVMNFLIVCLEIISRCFARFIISHTFG